MTGLTRLAVGTAAILMAWGASQSPLVAQSCAQLSVDEVKQVRTYGTGHWVRYRADDPFGGVGAGVSAEWAPADRVVTTATFHGRAFGDGSPTAWSTGGGFQIQPLASRPLCLTLGFDGAWASGPGTSDTFSSLELPIGLGLVHGWGTSERSTSVYATGLVVFVWTDATLFDFAYAEQAVGGGAEAGIVWADGPIVTRLRMRFVGIDPDVGPHPLGDFGSELAFGFRF